MQRKSFSKLLLGTCGYIVMGNLLCTVMTISVAAFLSNSAIKVIAVIFTAILFHSLMFTAGFKDGLHEKKMLDLKRIDNIPNNRWISIGLYGFLFAIIPTIVLIVNKIAGFHFDFYMVYKLICGAVYPLSMLVSGNSIDEMSFYIPFIFIGFYAFIPLFCHVGFKMAISGNFTKEKIMYK